MKTSSSTVLNFLACLLDTHNRIGPFRHSDISVKAVNQHGGRVLIYIV